MEHLNSNEAIAKTRGKIARGKIVSVSPNAHGVAEAIGIDIGGGRTLSASLRDGAARILVPEDEISGAWKKVLELNAGKPLAVVYTNPRNPGSATTLIDTKTLAEIAGRIESVEYSTLDCWDDKELTEGKPGLEYCETTYACGKTTVEIPEEMVVGRN